MAKNPAPSDEQATPAASGKNRPTPSRAESVAGRRRPLVPDTKEAKKVARAQMQVKRDQARAGMAAGDEKYLPARDKGPQRRFVRDFIDSGWFVAEFIMPAMVVVILLSFISVPAIQFYSFVVLWGFILLVVVEMFITSWRTKRAVKRRFGETKLERGTGWYAAMRSLQMRFLRLPKPQVRRGAKLS